MGAGAAGLVVLRELLREGHTATVFEQEPRIGGTWVYDGDRPLLNGGLRSFASAILVAHIYAYAA